MDEGQEIENMVNEIWDYFKANIIPNLQSNRYPKNINLGGYIKLISDGVSNEQKSKFSQIWKVFSDNNLFGYVYLMWDTSTFLSFKYVDDRDNDFIITKSLND